MVESSVSCLGWRLRRTVVWALVTACALDSACTATSGNGSVRRQPPYRVQPSQAANSNVPPSTATDPRVAALAPLPPEPNTTVAADAALRVQLPFDREALQGELPTGSVAEYGSWVQLARVDVGLGYLDTLEPVNLGQWMLVQSDEQPLVFMYDNHSHRSIAKWPVAVAGTDGSGVLLAWPDRPGREPCFLSAGTNGIALYNAVSGRVMKQLTTSPVGQAQWSEDGNVLVVVNSNVDTQTSELSFYRRGSDLELELVATLATSERVDAWDLSRDNRFLARGFYPSGAVTIVDLHSGAERLRVSAPGHASSIEFSPDERFLAIGGEGVVVVDLTQPRRRAEYSHFYNNVSEVEYSPNGDVLAVASYDGRVRLIHYLPKVNAIELVHTLRHDRQANVYDLRFIDSGATLVSSSGDRSIRYWGSAATTAALPTHGVEQTSRWQSIGERLPAESGTARSAPEVIDGSNQHYVPVRLNAAPSPSRIVAGKYGCKISELYKLRDCFVEKDARGHTLLEFSKDNLLGIRGVLYDDGPVVRFEGWLTEGGTLGCDGCQYEPIHGVLKGKGNNWEGVLLYRKHFDPLIPHEPPGDDVTIEEAIDRYPVVLKRR